MSKYNNTLEFFIENDFKLNQIYSNLRQNRNKKTYVTKDNFLLKIAYNNLYSNKLENEYKSLLKIHEFANSAYKNYIPIPILFSRKNDYSYSLQTYLTGIPLNDQRIINRDKNYHNLKLVTKWLSSFNSSCKDVSTESSEEYVNAALKLCKKKYNKTDLPKRLPYKDITLIFQHEDFWGGNILKSGNKLNIVDWEESKLGLPLTDFFDFTLWYGLGYENKDYTFTKEKAIAGFSKGFFEENEFSESIKKNVFNYCSKMKIDEENIERILLGYLVISSAFEYKNRFKSGESDVCIELLNIFNKKRKRLIFNQ